MTWKEAVLLSSARIAERPAKLGGETPWRVHLQGSRPGFAIVRVLYGDRVNLKSKTVSNDIAVKEASRYTDWEPVHPHSPLKALIDLLD